MSAAIIVIVIWIYKEIRNSLIEAENHETGRIDKALLAFGELETALLSYKENKGVNYRQKIDLAYPYLNKRLIAKANSIKNIESQSFDM